MVDHPSTSASQKCRLFPGGQINFGDPNYPQCHHVYERIETEHDATTYLSIVDSAVSATSSFRRTSVLPKSVLLVVADDDVELVRGLMSRGACSPSDGVELSFYRPASFNMSRILLRCAWRSVLPFIIHLAARHRPSGHPHPTPQHPSSSPLHNIIPISAPPHVIPPPQAPAPQATPSSPYTASAPSPPPYPSQYSCSAAAEDALEKKRMSRARCLTSTRVWLCPRGSVPMYLCWSCSSCCWGAEFVCLRGG